MSKHSATERTLRSKEAGGGVSRPAADLASIGDVAQQYNVTLRALRFYEDKGLLRPLRQGHMRYYRAQDCLRLKMILTGKQLGFTLKEIAAMLPGEADEAGQDAADAFERTLRPEQVTAQIDHLERQRSEIDVAIAKLRNSHRAAATGWPSDDGERLRRSA